MLGGLSSAGSVALAAGGLGVAGVATAAPPTEPASDERIGNAVRTYVALAGKLGIPLVTKDPVGWESRADDHVPPGVAARADYAFTALADAHDELRLDAGDVYGSTTRLNAALRSRPDLAQLASFGLAAVVDHTSFIDTAALAAGNFPESSGQSLPKLEPYPLG